MFGQDVGVIDCGQERCMASELLCYLLRSKCVAPTALQPNLLAYPPFRRRMRSPQGGLTCFRA